MLWEGAVILDFLEGALPAFQTHIVGKINAPAATLSDAITDSVAAAQDLSIFQREGHSSPCLRNGLCTDFGVGYAQNCSFLLYYKRLCQARCSANISIQVHSLFEWLHVDTIGILATTAC
jgi:hypothetical protein